MTGAATSHWRGARYAVWSPFVAWVLAVLALATAGRLGFDPGATSFVVGLTLGVFAFGGLFIATGVAVQALLETLDAPDLTVRERARLALLSLVGVSVSLIGYGGLVVLCGFIVLMSPFHDIRH